jgi:hypothetical protein
MDHSMSPSANLERVELLLVKILKVRVWPSYERVVCLND